MPQKFEVSKGDISFIINLSWDANPDDPIFSAGDALILLREIK